MDKQIVQFNYMHTLLTKKNIKKHDGVVMFIITFSIKLVCKQQYTILYYEVVISILSWVSSGQTLGVKAQRFRGHTSPHRNVKEKKKILKNMTVLLCLLQLLVLNLFVNSSILYYTMKLLLAYMYEGERDKYEGVFNYKQENLVDNRGKVSQFQHNLHAQFKYLSKFSFFPIKKE
eukprot:TRINITY_DN11081_c0_g1_i10.p11 TRINITY_DN11081_c0_g1~~TRINITY_DN11081_c0_g1_i10.p11  ORF type:complete len:175 (-),score=12.34 TRINITY_DN11081_c0_g1_i10:1416-1940(-)